MICEHANTNININAAAGALDSNVMSINDDNVDDNDDDDCNNHFNDSSTHDTILLDIDEGGHHGHDDGDDDGDHDDPMIMISSVSPPSLPPSSSSSSSLSLSLPLSSSAVELKEMEMKIKTLHNQIYHHHGHGEDDNGIENINENTPDSPHRPTAAPAAAAAPHSPRTTITITTTTTTTSDADVDADADVNHLIQNQMNTRTADNNNDNDNNNNRTVHACSNLHKPLSPSELELRRSLNDQIHKLQSKVEQHRVEKLQLEQQDNDDEEEVLKVNTEEILSLATSTSTSSCCCPLCSHPFPKRTKYNDRTYEYFTCCGTPICAVCHSTFVVCCIDDVDGGDGATPTAPLSPIPAAAGERKISVHHESLLKIHACPFCEEPWSVDEITDSQRILKLAEDQLKLQLHQKQHQQQGRSTKCNDFNNNNNNIWAQVEIARRYEHGMGVEPNEELAMKWFHIAAAATATATDINTTKASTKGERRHQHMNASTNNPNDIRNAVASAHYHIGRFYKWGMVSSLTPSSPVVGEGTIQEQGQGQGQGQGQHQSDKDHHNNCDISSNTATSMNVAKHYFLLAAEQNHARAQHDLATMIVDEYYQSERRSSSSSNYSLSLSGNAFIKNKENGEGNKIDIRDDGCEEAIYWYTLSLLQGYDEALYGIGNLFFMRGKMKTNKLRRAFDFGKAIYWLRQSAKKGLARGQMILGMALLDNARNTYGHNLYEYTNPGYNVVPEVFHWLRKSSFNGELDAGTRLKNCQNVHLKQCAFCRRSGCNLQWKKCHRCAGVSYCSVSCQKKDWECGHANDCYEDELMHSTATEGPNSIAINILD